MKGSEVLNIKNRTIYSENCKTAWNRNRQCREAGGRGVGGRWFYRIPIMGVLFEQVT